MRCSCPCVARSPSDNDSFTLSQLLQQHRKQSKGGTVLMVFSSLAQCVLTLAAQTMGTSLRDCPGEVIECILDWLAIAHTYVGFWGEEVRRCRLASRPHMADLTQGESNDTLLAENPRRSRRPQRSSHASLTATSRSSALSLPAPSSRRHGDGQLCRWHVPLPL